MRILDKSGVMLGISELGFFEDDQKTIERIINFPDGIFLVTGTYRFRQDNLALLLPARTQPADQKDHHSRRPRRIRIVGYQPSSDRVISTDLRRALRAIAPGAKHHHGR